jgi:hypothetical protein
MPISNPLMPLVSDGVHVDDLPPDTSGLQITARIIEAQAACPGCGRSSTRVYSACR